MPKIKRTRKYFAPQTEDKERKCDHPGCDKAGEYRWNYYDGEIPEEDDGPKAKMHFNGFRSKVRYKHGYSFKDNFGFFGDDGIGGSSFDDNIMYNAEERRCLEIMELKISEVSIENLKRQYKKLAKKYHPDTNQGDKTAEEKFKQLTNAYSLLLAKLS